MPVERSGNKFGRVTRGACKALISRVCLYAASKLFNGSDFAPADFPKELLGYPTYDKERWKIAVDAALDVIKMKQYDLCIRNEMRIMRLIRDGDIMHSCYLLIIMEKWERRFIAVQSLKRKQELV